MKQRGTFEYYTTATDDIGGTTQTWNTLATVWYNMSPMKGREAYEMGAIKGNVPVEITTRYRGDFVDAGYSRETYDYNLRLVDESGEVYNIEYAINKGREDSYTYLMAVREVGDES